MCDLNVMWRKIGLTLMDFGQLQDAVTQIRDSIRDRLFADTHMCTNRSIMQTMRFVVAWLSKCPREHHLLLLRAIVESLEACGVGGASAEDSSPHFVIKRLRRNCPLALGLVAAFDENTDELRRFEADYSIARPAKLNDDALEYAAGVLAGAVARGDRRLQNLEALHREQLAPLVCCAYLQRARREHLAALATSRDQRAFRRAYEDSLSSECAEQWRARRMLAAFPSVASLLRSGRLAQPETPPEGMAADVWGRLLDDVWDWLAHLILPRGVSDGTPAWRPLLIFFPPQVAAYMKTAIKIDRSLLQALAPDLGALLAVCGETLIGDRIAAYRSNNTNLLAEFGFRAPPLASTIPLHCFVMSPRLRCQLMVSHEWKRHELLDAFRAGGCPSVAGGSPGHRQNILAALVVYGKLLCMSGECYDACDPESHTRPPLSPSVACKIAANITALFDHPALREPGAQYPAVCEHVRAVLARHAPPGLSLPVVNWLNDQELAGVQFLDLPPEVI